MNIIILVSEVPYRKESKKGIMTISLQSYAIIEELIKQGHTLTLQIIFNPLFSKIYEKNKLDKHDKIELQILKNRGVDILKPIYSSDYQNTSIKRRILRFMRIIFKKSLLIDYYPTIELSEKINELINKNNINYAISLASKEGVGSLINAKIPKLDWHGDMDHFGLLGRNIIKKQNFFKQKFLIAIKSMFQYLCNYDECNLNESKKNEALISRNFIVAHSTYSNVKITKNFGNKNTFYTGNPVRDYSKDKIKKISTKNNKFKIIGQIGNFDTTGRYFAMKYLMDDLYPKLNHKLNNKFEIYLYSSYKIPKYFKKFTENENVILSSWVENFTQEMKSCDIILILENTGPFIAAQTKHIVSLSMGLCMVLHKNSKKAIPELMDGYNCIMGSTPDELVKKIKMLIDNKDLKKNIQINARLTYEKYFMASVTANKIIGGFNLEK